MTPTYGYDAVKGRHFLAIGDPGRAAQEITDGHLPARVGPPDVELSMASLPGMLVRAVSSRGLLHKSRSSLRQDAFALGRRAVRGEPERVIALVCDGVGSLDCSDCAAALVSHRLAEFGSYGVSWPEAFASVSKELYKVASEAAEADAGGMATTAVAVTVSRQGTAWLGDAAWVGDSTLWHLGHELEWTLVTGSQRQDGELDYYSSAVQPMPTRDGSCTWCSFRIDSGALFVMTDGVGNALLWSAEVRATLASWWARPPEPFTFAAQVGFAKKTYADDRTVVGIWPDGIDEKCV